jgi:hypothetical protein
MAHVASCTAIDEDWSGRQPVEHMSEPTRVSAGHTAPCHRSRWELSMSRRSSKGITHLKSAHGKPGSGVVARHPDGLVTSAGELDDGRWFCMAVTPKKQGAFAIGDTHTEAVAQICDDLDLSKARIIGGRYAADT